MDPPFGSRNYWPATQQYSTQYLEELTRLFGDNMRVSRRNPSTHSTSFDMWNPGYQYNRNRNNSYSDDASSTCGSFYSQSSPSSTCGSPPISPCLNTAPFSWSQRNTWDDFASNGVDCDLDEIDKIMRRNNLDKNVRSSTLGQGRAAELLEATDPALLMKNKLLLLIRDAERNKLNKRKKPAKVCVFCKNNGECEAVYGCHTIKDEQGRVTCPILYCYKCPKCGEEGDRAHTLKYCPLSTDTYVDSKAIRTTARTAAGKRRFPVV